MRHVRVAFFNISISGRFPKRFDMRPDDRIGGGSAIDPSFKFAGTIDADNGPEFVLCFWAKFNFYPSP